NLLASSYDDLDEKLTAWLKNTKIIAPIVERFQELYDHIIVVYIPVSTTCYDDSTKDYSRRAASKVVLDNQTHFRETVLKLCNELRPNLILKTGGTGINSDDITPEVTS
ncbi:unnamed protein product, partial [Rotaria magnacalcarata]